MANETLLLRKGLLANLASAPIVEGALSFTTDEPAIYIDVDGKHLRIGDIKEYQNMEKLKEFLGETPLDKIPTTGLYYAIDENALMKCAINEEGKRYWQQINVNYSGNISDLDAKITAINTAMGSKPKGWSDASIWAAIAKNREDIATNAKNISDEIARADAEEKRLAGLIADNADAVATEKSRAESVEAGLNTAIADEASRADTEEKRLAGLIADNAAAINVNAGDITTLKGNVSDLSANKADKSSVYTQTEVDATVQGLNTSITNLSNNKADKSSVYTKTEVDGFVQGAKDHSDANLATAESYADGKLVEAKAYTDEKVGAVNKALTGFQTSVNESLSGINGEITNLKTADTNIGLRIDGVVSRVEAVESGKADAATTLEGYGITDAYTKAETETAIDKKIAAVNASNQKVAEDLDKLEAAVGKVPTDKTVLGIIDELSNNVDLTITSTITNVNTYTDNKVKAEKERAEGAETALTQSISTLRTDMNTLVGVVPEGSDNVIDYINDSQAAQNEAITSAYEAYVDSKLQAADAMTFKGIVHFNDVDYTDKPNNYNSLPTTGVKAGDTYKVGGNGTVGSEKVWVGDLIIANSDQEDGATNYNDWSIVHSGYEDDHDVHIELNDGVIEIISAVGASRGGIKIEGNYVAPDANGKTNGGVRVTLSESDPDAGIIDVTAKVEMVWGSF